MSVHAQWPASFPFLSLPRELQAEVVRHVCDIVALRDLLAMPQVARSVAPFLRLVTNDDRPHWFIGLEKYVKHLDAKELPADGIGTDGFICILDLLLARNFDPSLYLSLRKPIVAFTVADQNLLDYYSLLIQSVDIFTRAMHTETMAIIGQTGLCNFAIFPENMSPNNLTFVDCECVSLSDPLLELQRKKGTDHSISLKGSLRSLSIGGMPPDAYAEDMTLVYNYCKELIDGTNRLSVFPYDSEESRKTSTMIYIDGWEIPLLSDHHEFLQCSQFRNVKLNTRYTNETSDIARNGELLLEMKSPWEDYDGREKIYPPVISNVSAPGLRNVTVNVMGSFFPALSMLWFPHLEVLKLTAKSEEWERTVSFQHLNDVAQAQELSKLVHGVKDLYVDQYTAPALGFVLPSSFEKLRSLTLQEDTMNIYDKETALDVERLKLKHGKIRMPKLNRLEWSSISETNERVLDFSQLSSWFSFPRLKTLVFESRNKYVSLKAIAHQVPKIKELHIKRLPPYDPTWKFQNDTYPMPMTGIPHTTFAKLERFVFSGGYDRSSFNDIRFPRLKHLELSITLDTESKSWVKAEMPLLESMVVDTTDEKTHGVISLHISNFKELRNLTIGSDIELLSMPGCTKLERIIHTGQGLTSLYGPPQEGLLNLKTLRYNSLISGKPCHSFRVSPLVDVDIR